MINVISYHFESGIPFSGNSAIKASIMIGSVVETYRITLSGYVPCPDPCQTAGVIPAVGSFGQAVMVLVLVVVGSVLLRRRNDGASHGTVAS